MSRSAQNRQPARESVRPLKLTTRILLIASTTGYQVRSFADASQRLKIELILATDRCHVLDNPWGDDAIAISDGLDALAARGPFNGIVAVGDQPAFIAAQV